MLYAMRKWRITLGKVGLVFRKGNFERVLPAGDYWMFRGEQVMVYDMSQPFTPPVELNLLLQDEMLNALLDVIEVGDSEIVLHLTSGLFRQVLRPGRYAFFKGLVKHSFIRVDMSAVEVPAEVPPSLLLRPELQPYLRVFTVEHYEKALLYVNGALQGELDRGMYFYLKNHLAVDLAKADMRQLQMEISGQEILTADKANLRISFYLHYQVEDLRKALHEVKEYEKQLYVLAQLAIRDMVGSLPLDELLERKDAVSKYVLAGLRERAANLGVRVLDGGVRDIILPGDMKDIMNQVLVAQKKAQANTIMRREETASVRSLLNTARLMEENEMLYRLKEMEYVEKIAEKIGNISVSGGGLLADQLRDIFSPRLKKDNGT